MIKIKILKEDLKHSSSAFKNIFSILKSSKSTGQDKLFAVDIPYREVSFNNKSILNGLVLTHLINNLGNESLNEFEKYWDKETKKFSDKLINKILSLSFNAYAKAVYSSTPENEGGKFSYKTAKESSKTILKINVFMKNSKSDVDLGNTIVHELQHFTQFINQLSRDYNEQLKIVKSLDEIKPLRVEDLTITVGIGKTPTGIKYNKAMSKEDYYISDDEYETYLTSMINTCYYYVVVKKLFDPTKESISSFASNFIKKIISDKSFANNVFISLGVANLIEAFDNILSVRKKELIKDLYQGLQKRLKRIK